MFLESLANFKKDSKEVQDLFQICESKYRKLCNVMARLKEVQHTIIVKELLS